jgi:uncharacterized coiled-coil DUF342 family protein
MPTIDDVKEVLRGLYVCRRARYAWDAGMMSEDDFVRADEDDDAVSEVLGLVSKAQEGRDAALDRAEIAQTIGESWEETARFVMDRSARDLKVLRVERDAAHAKIRDLEAEVERLRAERDAATARIEELEASTSNFSGQQAEVDALRKFAADMGTLVDADPSDLKALSAAVKQMILTIGMQRLTLEDVERLDAELREKMVQALDRARSKAKVEGAKEERARVLTIIREQSISRAAQVATCHGVTASLAYARSSECLVLATMIDDTDPASPEKLIE